MTFKNQNFKKKNSKFQICKAHSEQERETQVISILKK